MFVTFRRISLFRILLSAFLVMFSIAAVAQETQRLPVDQAGTEQKAKFLENLVTKSVSAQTIEDSGDAAALAGLQSSRALVNQAQVDLKSGNYEQANQKLDEALRLVNSEARRLSEGEVKGDRLQEAYNKRLLTVATFLKAYERVAVEKGGSGSASALTADIRSLVAEANGLAGSGQYEQANQVLDRAYKIARGDIREMREGETLTRSLNFANAQEEYEYEKNRNNSHVMLLKFAVSEKKPPQNYVDQIDKLRREATALRDRAEGQASSGQHPEAIATISKSTDTLLKAIRMSGIYIPG